MPMVIACVGTSSPKSAEFAARDGAGARVEWRAGLVEGDVAVAAEAQERQVEASAGGDVSFVTRAFGRDIGCRAVRQVRVRGIDVDEVEEVSLHEAVVTAGMGPFDADVLIEVERHHLTEAVVRAAAGSDDPLVHAHRRPPRWQAEDHSRAAEDRLEENLGGAIGENIVVGERFPVHFDWLRRETSQPRDRVTANYTLS